MPPRWLITAAAVVEAAGLVPLIWLSPHCGYLPLIMVATAVEGTGLAGPTTHGAARCAPRRCRRGRRGHDAVGQLGSSVGAARDEPARQLLNGPRVPSPHTVVSGNALSRHDRPAAAIRGCPAVKESLNLMGQICTQLSGNARLQLEGIDLANRVRPSGAGSLREMTDRSAKSARSTDTVYTVREQPSPVEFARK
jgi:hypothetical protein